ncbi:MFS transporter [Streptomyces sp. LHD-70]|uniref:MFS transporter n=1 Tax=Streptomyces sp. LHD-70 TaxID=3072140 RepID=UPI00280F4442|nr:MFS transporter [Streptomyces sp. LHD-70]MDQ8706099.1 MFS transporter [Streptomyces sp. LHD-70]
MTARSNLIDDAPLTRFHKKLTAYSSGGPFIDGYAIAIIGVAFTTLTPALDMTTGDKGLVAAASLVGIFFGGAVFGYVTDKIGRHIMYIADLAALALFSVLSAFATEVWQLVLLRFLLGAAIGADYPIATSLLAEYVPRRFRGRLLGATFVVWALGAAAAYVVGVSIEGLGADAWRFMLASPAVFAVVTLFLRLGTPESPRWLLSKGRTEEAERAVKKVFGPQYGVADVAEEPAVAKAGYTTVFRSPYLRRTVFVGVFWTAQVIPLFALYSFAPDLLAGMGISGTAAEVFLAALFVIGGVPGLWLVERIGRRALLLWSFGIIAVALAVPGLMPGLPSWVTFAAVCVFALASGGSSFLEVVYPNELFPTEVRATAVGVGTALSRIGAAAATYLMPFALAESRNLPLLIGAVVSVVGLLATLAWGVETRNRSLSDTAAGTERPAEPSGPSLAPTTTN